MTPEEYDEYETAIAVAANATIRRFSGYVDREDCVQALWEWVLKHPEQIRRWREEAEANGEDFWKLGVSLSHAAKDFCQREKAQVLGYSLQDLAYYEVKQVEELLDSFFDRDAWDSPPAPAEGRRSGDDPAKSGNWIASLSDISRAYDSLDKKTKGLLFRYHAEHMTQQQIADEDGVTKMAISKALERAYARMSDYLGGFRPDKQKMHEYDENGHCECYVGNRKAMSNAHACAMTSHAYDGD